MNYFLVSSLSLINTDSEYKIIKYLFKNLLMVISCRDSFIQESFYFEDYDYRINFKRRPVTRIPNNTTIFNEIQRNEKVISDLESKDILFIIPKTYTATAPLASNSSELQELYDLNNNISADSFKVYVNANKFSTSESLDSFIAPIRVKNNIKFNTATLCYYASLDEIIKNH